MVDANDMQRARDYVSAIVWRLETLQFRTRFNHETGENEKLPVKIRRFSNGIPRDIVLPVLRIIAEGSPYTGRNLFNGEGSDDKFVSTNVYIRKDQTLETGRRSDASYTIIQDLLLMDASDSLSTMDYLSCSRVSTSEYRWDEDHVESLPEGSPKQGVIYQITNISKSAETDLFSYQVKKSVAVTQHQPEAVVMCDARRRSTVEVWDNVYGQPGWFSYDSVRNGGGSITIPSPCTASDGTTVTVELHENEDCTYRVTVRRTTVEPGFELEYMRYYDQFKAEHSDTIDGQRQGLSKDGLRQINGVITRYESQQNDDGTWRNKISQTVEQEVMNSTVAKTVSPFLEEVRWVDTATSSAATALPSDYLYGRYETTVTPGGRYTNTYTGYKVVGGDVGVTCESTKFLHTHVSEALIPSLPPLADPAVEAHQGVVTTLQYSVNTDTGAVTERKTEKTEICVPGSTVSVSQSLRNRTLRVVDSNLQDLNGSTIDGVDLEGYAQSASLNVGDTLELVRNPGGSVTRTRTTKTVDGSARLVHMSCLNTAQEHVHVQDSVVGNGPLNEKDHQEAVSAGTNDQGKAAYQQVEYTLDEDNVVTKRVTDTVENSVKTTRRYHRSHLETTSQEETTSSKENPADNNREEPPEGQVFSIDAQMTRGGHYTVVRGSTQAVYKTWEDQIKSADDILFKIGFRNATADQVKELRDSVETRMKDSAYADKPEDRYDQYDPFINRMVNEYGLYDGSVGYSAKRFYSQFSSASGGSSKPETDPITTRVQSKTYQVLPNSSEGYVEAGEDMSFVLVTKTYTTTSIVGVGADSYKKACQDVNSQKIVGDIQTSIGPGFQYHITYTSSESVKVELVTVEAGSSGELPLESEEPED